MPNRRFLLSVLVLLVGSAGLRAQDKKPPIKLPDSVPAKVGKVLEYVDEHNKAMDGYEGGRNFGNFEKLLPQRDDKGKAIKYREWDVNPLRRGVNRGAQRLITGSDNSAYYTDDHYKTFKKIR
jgi:guanyl-specific ribonuclease Sa